ncbi:MAG: hypothetical protein H7Y20_17020, partial [Bryobacteraceae bacterium]|nr:hypothetical protein [Bryobacteraceae bacterium]
MTSTEQLRSARAHALTLPDGSQMPLRHYLINDLAAIVDGVFNQRHAELVNALQTLTPVPDWLAEDAAT